MEFEILHDYRIIRLLDATEMELNQLELSLTRQVDGWHFKKKKFKSNWDGYVSFIKNKQLIPMGLWRVLYDIGQTYGYPIRIHGVNQLLDIEVTLEDVKNWIDDFMDDNTFMNKNGYTVREYQYETVFKIVKFKNSLNELATSAGKTLITFLAIGYMLDKGLIKKALMIVPNVSLVEQGMDDFEDYNDGKLDVHIQPIFAGKKMQQRSNIVIGTFQSLVKKDDDYFKEFDLVIVDEAHRAKAQSIKEILAKCTASKYRFGLTGTLPKKGSLDELNLMSQLGPVVSNVNARFLMDEGHISPVEVKMVYLNYAEDSVREALYKLYKTDEDRKRIMDLERNYIIKSQPRLEFIIDLLKKTTKNTMILFHRQEYGKRIYNALRNEDSGKVSMYVDGEVDKDIRKKYINLMEKGTDKILIASYGTFAEGISINNIHTVIFAESFKSDSLIRQSIGRGLRKHKSKDKLILIDLIDDITWKVGKKTVHLNYGMRHANERKEIYEQQKFPYSKIPVNI